MKRIRHTMILIATAVTASLLLISCAAPDPVTGRRPFNLYSMQDDIALGRQVKQANVEEMQKAGVRINADARRVAQLQAMMERIAAVSDLPNLPYEVTLFHTNIVNAAAAPGGAMMVFEGLYDPKIGLVEDEQELAAVIAHEIAHINCRHVTERLSVIMPAALGIEVIAGRAERKDREQTAQILRGVFVVGAAVWIPYYSRRDEEEADRVGLFYMARAGYDPRAAVRIWQRAYEQQDGKDKTSIFATHPSSRDRYKKLERMLPYAMEKYAAVVGGYPRDYTPPPGFDPSREYDWRRP